MFCNTATCYMRYQYEEQWATTKQLIAHSLCIKLLKAVLQNQNETHNYCHLKRETKWHESVGLFIFSVMTIFICMFQKRCATPRQFSTTTCWGQIWSTHILNFMLKSSHHKHDTVWNSQIKFMSSSEGYQYQLCLTFYTFKNRWHNKRKIML